MLKRYKKIVDIQEMKVYSKGVKKKGSERDMKNNIALEIVENAARKTNGKKFYFSNDEVAHYLEDKFHDYDLINIYNRLSGGEFAIIKEFCGECSSLNLCCSYLELYITIGEDTYLLYSQYDESCK